MKIELTKGQCESLAEMIEIHLLEIIRKDTDIDNLDWVRNILNAHLTFMEAAMEDGDGESERPDKPVGVAGKLRP